MDVTVAHMASNIPSSKIPSEKTVGGTQFCTHQNMQREEGELSGGPIVVGIIVDGERDSGIEFRVGVVSKAYSTPLRRNDGAARKWRG